MNLLVSRQITPPIWRHFFLYLGTLLALSVYYLNYDTNFDEGSTESMAPLSLAIRISAVGLIVMGLMPMRRWRGSAFMVLVLYLYGASSYILSVTLHGRPNDILFFNTLLQVPVLLALCGTNWNINYTRVFQFICRVLAIQVLVDILIWQGGRLLWLSEGFVGGVGNPSSFGLLCSLGFAFCVFHPLAGRARWIKAILLAFGSVQSKSMFAVLALAFVASIWFAHSWRRAAAGLISTIVFILTLTMLPRNTSDDGQVSFIEHKMRAVGALLHLVEYDVESSESVSQRMEIHNLTLHAIVDNPFGLLVGHLGGLPYWPMDSQLLTYLGSFGVPFVTLFILLNYCWIVRAWRQRHLDNGFAVLSLCIFCLIFLTNRILDYFPIATVYFVLISYVTNGKIKDEV